MIDIFLKNAELIRIADVHDLPEHSLDFFVMQFIDYTEQEVSWASEKFRIDLSIIKHYEDIEISSHFSASEKQISFHLSMPYYDTTKNIVESPVFFVISSAGLFFFSNGDVDDYINRTYNHKFSQVQKFSDINQFLKFQIEFISDYYADITESETKKIKALANTILLKKEFSNEVMDVITRYNFNNLLIKESLIEATRVFNLCRKSAWQQKINIEHVIESELNDLSVISDYIQFNFERLDDLKENVSNKIELEQNFIFKRLTIVTVCISLPTLIAGIYGMNFEQLPGVKSDLGYYLVLLAMILSFIVPIIYFKRKKWL